jgi:hypothetical protein
MKMAKASENDLNAALEMCRALDSLGDGVLPDEMTEGEDSVFYSADDHAEKVVDHLISIFKKASLFRVCFGMTVVLDPQNAMVDPNDGCLALHPKFARLKDDKDKLLWVLKACDISEFPYARQVIAEVEGV